MLHALVPVKALGMAKSRLAPLLGGEERQALVLAMLADVLAALQETPQVQAATVMSDDPRVRAVALGAGAQVRGDHGLNLNGALARAAADMATRGTSRLLIVFADVPLVTPGDLTAMINADADLVLGASNDGGTNAMLARLPLAICPRFGSQSLHRHIHAAAERGASVQVVRSPGIERDIDRADGLYALAVAGGNTAAARLARSFDLRTRVIL